MLFRTHIVFNFLIALILIEKLKIKKQILFTLIICFFGVFPDLDEKKSYLGKHILVKLKHRRFLHTIYPGTLISLFLFHFNPLMSFGVIIGYLAHLFLDGLTKKGITPFYPLKKKLKGFIKVGSWLENILFSFFLFIVIYKLLF